MEFKKFPLKVLLYKSGEMIYFSQLDLVHILERALRRCNLPRPKASGPTLPGEGRSLPLIFTQGFNPHVKISFSNALKLGKEGNIGVTFYFSEGISYDKLKESLQPQLPAGLEII